MMFKFFSLLLLLVTFLVGFDEFDYTVDVSKKSVVVKEAVIILVKLRQKSSGDVMRFDFSFVLSSNYQVELLESDESKDSHGRTYIYSKYLLFPLKEGDIEIEPKLIIKRASKEELKKFVTGSADELMYLQTKDKGTTLEPIKLHVRAVESDVVLVGDFKLTYKIDKKEIESGEQVNLNYVLSGKGYKPQLETLLHESSKVDTFLEKDFFDKGLFHKYRYLYALSAKEDFVVDKVSIVAYNPELKKRYILTAPSFDIVVNKSEVVKKPILQSSSISWVKYLNLMLLFMAGFLTQKMLKKLPKKQISEDEKFVNAVKSAKTPKELLKLLLPLSDMKYKVEIERLESMVYQNKNHKLSDIKSSILERFSTIDEYPI